MMKPKSPDPTPEELVVLVGVSGSGKTFLADWLSQHGWVSIADPMDPWGDFFMLIESAVSALQAGKRVVVDAECHAPDLRRLWVAAARRAGASPICLFLNTKPEVCAQRLARRLHFNNGVSQFWNLSELHRAAANDNCKDPAGEGFQHWVTARNQEVVNDFLRKRGFSNQQLLDAFGTPHRPPNSNPKTAARQKREAERDKQDRLGEKQQTRQEQKRVLEQEDDAGPLIAAYCPLVPPWVPATGAIPNNWEAQQAKSPIPAAGHAWMPSCQVQLGDRRVKSRTRGAQVNGEDSAAGCNRDAAPLVMETEALESK